MENKETAYLANPTEEVFHFNTVYGEKIAHVNIGTTENPFYLPQEMFKITDSFRKFLLKRLRNE